MKKFILLFFLLILNSCSAKHLYKESVYQNYWCTKRGGIQEYMLDDKSRVDCLLPNMAVEFDFAKKRDECIGQALRYAAYTDKQPACCLIIENKKDLKYLHQARKTIYKNDLNIKLYRVTPKIIKSTNKI